MQKYFQYLKEEGVGQKFANCDPWAALCDKWSMELILMYVSGIEKVKQ